MQLLGTDSYRTAIRSSLSQARRTLDTITAYLTIEGIEWILDCLPRDVELRVLSRWNLCDLAGSSSDIEVYDRLKTAGHSLFILPDLHAKLMLIDRERLFLGSANITASGLKLVPGGNTEVGVQLSPDEDDISFVEALFEEAIPVDDSIYEFFREYLNSLTGLPFEAARRLPQWPPKVSAGLRPPNRLWVAETLWSGFPADLLNDFEGEGAAHDRSLLGIYSSEVNDVRSEHLRYRLLESRVWKWLLGRLRSAPNYEMYFGALTAELHRAFLDDPKPYRRDVKELLSNLMAWASELCPDYVLVDRPSHSQRVRLIKT